MNKPAGSQGAGANRPSAPGIGREFSSLKEHGSATIAELQEFLVSMKGKSTREFLGALAESGLVKATAQATLGAILVAAVFTVGPYMLGQASAKTTAGNGAPAAAKGTTPTGATTPGTDAANPTAATTAGSTAAASPDAPVGGAATAGASGTAPVSQPDLQKAAEILGVGETKKADPKTNPLEKDLDSLLDKVK